MPAQQQFSVPFELSNKDHLHLGCLVNGQSESARSGQTFDIVDPGSGRTWASCPDCDESDVNAAVESAHRAFLNFSKWTPRKRAQCLLRWHTLIVDAREDLARILVHETGKPLKEALGEVDYATTFTWWFVGEAERAHGTTIQSAIAGRRSLTVKQPIGVVAALIPWNFPIALALRKASAAMAAGCTMVMKPSPETPISTISLARLAIQAGFPPGALNVLTTSLKNTPAVAEGLCLHPLVKKVTFTGSTRVGKIIASLCSRSLKKTTLELGGNCPFIVFEDADTEMALDQLAALKWRHAGQACVSANRVYVHRSILEEFLQGLIRTTSLLRVGHGMEDQTTLGPVTTLAGLDKAEELVKDAVGKGAKMLLGTGRRLAGPSDAAGSLEAPAGGFFMAPTILTGVTDTMRMSQEEIFAPVLGISVFDTEEEVTARANETSMGLASYVFTKDVNRLWRMFENLEAGMIGLVRKPLHSPCYYSWICTDRT